MNSITRSAEVCDAVVIDSTKFRIRVIEGDDALVASAGPAWRRTPIVARIRLTALRWDKIPAVWRVAK